MKIRPQVYTTPGQILLEYVDECKPVSLVETGCLRRDSAGDELSDGWSTLYFAQWCAKNGGHLISIDVDHSHIDIAMKMVEKANLGYMPGFLCGESVHILKQWFHYVPPLFQGKPVDFAYLDTSDDPVHGRMEFQEVERLGARMIIMDDHDSKVIMAEQYAKDNGWNVEQDGRFTIMRRQHA